MRRPPLIAIAVFVASLAPTAPVQAGDAVAAARRFLQHETRHLADEVDVQMRAPNTPAHACRDPEPFLPGSSSRLLGRITVGVRCSGEATRYLQARVLARGRYWVAARDIPAGTRVVATMLDVRHGNLNSLPRRVIHDRDAAIGKVTTRHLGQGTVLLQSQLRAPWLVRQGHTVTVIAGGPGFHVSRQARALQSGALHNTVRLRMANRAIISATVVAAGRVRVTP